MNPTILPHSMSKTVEETMLFNFGMATGLDEGKIWIQTWQTA